MPPQQGPVVAPQTLLEDFYTEYAQIFHDDGAALHRRRVLEHMFLLMHVAADEMTKRGDLKISQSHIEAADRIITRSESTPPVAKVVVGLGGVIGGAALSTFLCEYRKLSPDTSLELICVVLSLVGVIMLTAGSLYEPKFKS